MISLKNTSDVKKAFDKISDAVLYSTKFAVAECEAEVMAELYGGECEAAGGIEIGEDLIKKEFGSEDNPPSPIIETAVLNHSSEIADRIEETFQRKMEED